MPTDEVRLTIATGTHEDPREAVRRVQEAALKAKVLRFAFRIDAEFEPEFSLWGKWNGEAKTFTLQDVDCPAEIKAGWLVRGRGVSGKVLSVDGRTITITEAA